MRYIFGDYVLDTQHHELHHAGEPVPLRRRVFQVLAYLVPHRDRVVSKQELLEQLWPDQFVGDAALTSCLKTLRRALGERGRTPRYLRTLHGQGYRFVAHVEEREHRPVDVTAPPSCSLSSGVCSAVPPVGREVELTRLHAWLARACRGVRQVVFVTGEVGLGKTTLVEAFVAQLGHYGPPWIGCGQCVEHYGSGEAYLPVLEALGRLCRGAPVVRSWWRSWGSRTQPGWCRCRAWFVPPTWRRCGFWCAAGTGMTCWLPQAEAVLVMVNCNDSCDKATEYAHCCAW